MKNLFKASSAFTLAEILVSLTIIGVVAALTISNVMINTNAAHAKTALKKAMASLNQAVLQSATMDGYDCSETIAAVRNVDAPSVYNIVEKYMGAKILANDTQKWEIYANFIFPPRDPRATAGYIFQIPPEDEEYSMLGYYYYMLPDNMALIMPQNIVSCGQPRLLSSGNIPTTFADSYNATCIAFLDINGAKGPNQVIGCDEPPTLADGSSMSAANEYVFGDPVFYGGSFTCKVSEKAVTDVFPIVFHNDKVYPATYASNTVYLDAQQSE